MITKQNISNNIFKGFFIALGAVAEIIAFALVFNLKIGFEFYLIVIAMALIIYLFDFSREYKYTNVKIINSFPPKLILYLTIFLLFAIYGVVIIKYGSLNSIIFSFILLVAGLSYDPFLKPITKSIIGFKDIYVAICWNTLIILFILFYNYNFSFGIILFLVFVFSRDFVNASFCDLKDLRSDAQKKLLTFAEVFNRDYFLRLLQILNVISAVILLIGIVIKFIPFIGISLLIPIIFTAFFIEYSKRKRFFSSYFVDLEYFIWLISVLFFKYLIL